MVFLFILNKERKNLPGLHMLTFSAMWLWNDLFAEKLLVPAADRSPVRAIRHKKTPY